MYNDCEYIPLGYRVYTVSIPEQEVMTENAHDAWRMFEKYVLNTRYSNGLDEQKLDNLICKLAHDFDQYNSVVYFDAHIKSTWYNTIE